MVEFDEDDFKRKVPKGAVKAGLDTCFLYNIVSKNIDIKWLKENYFPSNIFFYYCSMVEKEFKGLLRKSGLTGLEAKREWEKISDALNLIFIRWGRDIEREYIPKVRDANEKLAKRRDIPGFSKTFRIGQGDVEIIASFMKEKVDRIYTSDDGFYQTCKELGLNAIKVKLAKYWGMRVKDDGVEGEGGE